MNWINLLPMFVQIAQAAVLTIQGIHGDQVSGKDKMTMATDAFNTVVAGVVPTLPTAQQGIAQMVSVLGGVALQSAYLITKANGTYAAATKVAAASAQTPAAASATTQVQVAPAENS